MRNVVSLVVLAVVMADCRAAPPPGPPPPDAEVRLTPATSADATPLTVTIAPDAALVRLRLANLDHSATDLMAEIEHVGGDQLRRWAMTEIPDAPAGDRLAVDVPGYEVRPGEHRLTVWVGDADVVARYAFRVTTP